MICPHGYAGCTPVYNGAELKAEMGYHGVDGNCKTTISSKGPQWG
jgi:hypothetical protein